MPVERPWGELLYHADAELIPIVAVAANIESLHRMTREERELKGLIVSGSDHLTAYNVYAEAVNKHGYLGEVYGLPRHLFRERVDQWAEGRGVLVKAIEDVALGTASVYRQLELALPDKLPYAGEKTLAAFAELVARIMPFDLVIDEETADGREARVSRGSVCGSWGRSEEHTSELQSQSNLVCRLLLEKKKITTRRAATRHAEEPRARTI